MINLSDDAKKYLDEYLQQIDICLSACKSVDADEIRQNVMDHIENELKMLEPVGADELRSVLKRLGSPSQWVPEDELSWWRKMILRLRTGPEDWRLVYFSFGLLILGLLFPPLFIFSFLLARAAICEADKAAQKLDTQKWLIYPQLLLVYVPLASAIFLWPSFLFSEYLEKPEILFPILGSWWIILGLVFFVRPKWPILLFRPFVSWWNRKQALALIAIGLLFVGGLLLDRFSFAN